jgi:hypothetical protein
MNNARAMIPCAWRALVSAAVMLMLLAAASVHAATPAKSSTASPKSGTTTKAGTKQKSGTNTTASAPDILADSIAAHMRYLADDRLEGRGTGTRGYELAARYVAARFEAIGLEPAGADSSWYQSVPFRWTKLVRPDGATLTWTRSGRTHRLSLEEDFLMSADPVRTEARVSAEVVFAGHGITAPELHFDDFAGVDVRGKIVCLLSGAPKSFPTDQRAYYSSSRTKEENLVAHGAIGYLTVRTTEDETRNPWARSVRQSRQGGMKWLGPSGEPEDVRPTLQVNATLSRAAAESLFAGGPHPLADVFADDEKGEARGFEMGVRAELTRKSRFESIKSPNVIGLLRGSDPKLRNQVVVYTAHLDHLGITTPVDGDSINNGALDNASGISCVLEIARAFAKSPRRPKRSILFLALTGEERGLLGSDYFIHHPTVPQLEIVANVNLDEFLMLFPLADVVVHGAEHSTLGDAAAEAAKPLGFTISPDPAPAEVSFIRSDQYSFVRHGIPAIEIIAGRTSTSADIDGNARIEEWLHSVYHSPKDDMSQTFDFPSIVRFARLNYAIGERVANDATRPAWRPGDFFGDTFGEARH